ncbi:unnamed protein product [Rotaria magnacalcarata]|uniref:C2H2-type domain-containing protein n=1 Tax=Rotaria magnacalcarata TaxID=392030 RepID=A0A816MCK8_9BILA|nr:unnamed protein product [Rotaria magnacalcarata]
MTGISEAYDNAESWQSRRKILSIVAPKVPLQLFQLSIPDLTSYRFSVARLHAAIYGIGSRVKIAAKVVQRFDDQQIAHFFDFIVSPHVCTDLPFDEKVLKLSSGMELFVPSTIRNMRATRNIDQYLFYCKEICSDFEPLGASCLFTIPETCKASTRKSLQGVNYFAAEAGEGFDGISKMIEGRNSLSSNSEQLIENLKRARFYLKSDYEVHVRRSSNVADHCCIDVLREPNRRNFSEDCDHDHDESCSECLNLTITLNEIKRFIEETEPNTELLDRALKKFRSYRKSIERSISWHITVVMKSDADPINETRTFDDDIDLSDINESAHDQDMTDLSELSENGDTSIDGRGTNIFKYKIFVHVFDQCLQDSETIVTILNDVLCRVKEVDPGISKAYVRSDNAGCYHSANTLVSAKQISEKTGIAIKRIDFCDRYAAIIKSNIRRYLNENHNVTNASEFIEACHSHKGVKGVLALDCQIENNDRKKEIKCKIKQISNYFNFDLTSKSQEGFAHGWIMTKEKPDDEITDVDDSDKKEDVSSNKLSNQRNLYECNVEEGCTSQFMKFGNLINHRILGKHNLEVEKFSLKDTAIKMYHSKLEEVENRRMISLDMSLVNIVNDEINLLSKGWALATRKSNIQFSSKQREYLKEKFNEGVTGEKHWKPKEVALGQNVTDFYEEDDDDDGEEGIEPELQELEDDSQEMQDDVNEIKIVKDICTRAKQALQSS